MISIADVNKVNNECLNLLSCTEYLRRDDRKSKAFSISEKIFESIRKLTIASMVREKSIICISGLQGVGKTTLIKTFYSLDDKYLNISRGRGECIPILITEKEDVTEPKMFKKIIYMDENDNYSIIDIEVEAEEFVSASRGDDSKIICLELFVPYTHTMNSGISFMLLPGFEKKRDYWNNLIEFSVNSSDAAVFVFNQTSFSSAENEDYLRKIEEKFGNNVVYAISGSDGFSEEINEEVRQTCIEVLNISANETDRVVCTGLYNDADKNLEWIKKLEGALDKYAYDNCQQLQRNCDYVLSEIEKIETSLYQILNIIKDDSDTSADDFWNKGLLNEFNKAYMKKRRMLEKNISIQFKKAKAESYKVLENEFDTFGAKARTIKRQFFGTSINDVKKTREMIAKSLNPSCSAKYLLDAISITFDSMKATGLKSTNLSSLVDSDNKLNENDNKQLLLNTNNASLVNDVNLLLSNNVENRQNMQIQCNNPKKLLGAVIEMGTYYFGQNTFYGIKKENEIENCELADTSLIPDEIIEKAIHIYSDTSKKISEDDIKKLAVGLAGIIGVDFASDGKLDGKISLPVGIATAFIANPEVAVALYAIGGCVSICSLVMKDINNMQRADLISAQQAVSAAYDNVLYDYLEYYDMFFDKIGEVIEDNISSFSGYGKQGVVEYNAQIAIHNTLDLLCQIKDKGILGEKYGIESAFR